MSDQLKRLPQHFYDRVWNSRDASAIDELLHQDFIHEGVTGEPIPGRDAFKELHRRLCATFSEIDFQIRHVICEGNQLAYQHAAQLKHEATGRTVSFGGVAIAEIEDGMFVRGVESVEWLALLQALDMVPDDILDELLGA